MDNKKIYMEETSGKGFRRFNMEQGTYDDNKEPDYVHELAQGTAKNAMILVNVAMRAIVPAIILGFIIFIVGLFLIFR